MDIKQQDSTTTRRWESRKDLSDEPGAFKQFHQFSLKSQKPKAVKKFVNQAPATRARY